MTLVRAFAFILTASARNQLVRQVKRLRQPRYLAATAVGVAYWWFYLGKQWFSGMPHTARSQFEARPAFVAGATVLFTLIALGGWLLGSDRSRLAFSEAEMQFLFPAPTTRRQLLHYKLLRSILVGLLSSLVYTLFFRRASGRPIFMTLGGWVAVTTLSMHWTAAGFVRKSLWELGLQGAKRTVFRLLAVAGFVALVVLAVQRTPLPASPVPGAITVTKESLLAWAQVVSTPPLGWVLWPVRAVLQPVFVGTWSEFGTAILPARAVLLAHYLWVIWSAESFEDDALATAERRARWRESRREGRVTILVPEHSRKPPFPLAPHGRPEVALVWRNLIRMSRVLRVRIFLVLFPIVVSGGLVGYFSHKAGEPGALGAMLGGLALSFYVLVVLMGPVIARSTLADPEQAEMLRSSPVSGFQVVTGETLGPLVVLAGIQWLLLVPAVFFLPGDVGITDAAQRLAVILAMAMVGPALSLGGILVQNAAAVLVPSWVSAGRERGGGPEALGMRLLVLLGNLLALALAAIPAAITGGVTAFLLWGFMGWGAAPIAAAVSTLTIAVEAGLAIAALGRAFDRYDLSVG